MYGLMVLWSLLAIGFAARALGIGGSGEWRVEGGGWRSEDRRGWRVEGGRWLVGYCVVMVLALYTQYYAGFLAVGLTVAGLVELWRQRRHGVRLFGWEHRRVVALLFLPWVLYAGPKLVSYVSQKVVADSDKPLGLIEYLARHLSAYTAGHLEGPLTPWWPIGLIGARGAGLGNLACGSPARTIQSAFADTGRQRQFKWSNCILPGHPLSPNHPCRRSHARLAGQPDLPLLPRARRTAPPARLAPLHPSHRHNHRRPLGVCLNALRSLHPTPYTLHPPPSPPTSPPS